MRLSSHITDTIAIVNVRGLLNDWHPPFAYTAGMVERPPHYLREWRKFRKMTQDELAGAVETTKSVISDMERDNLQMSPKWARRFAPILKTTPGYLLDVNPDEVDRDLLEIWTHIPEADRVQAAKVLRSFMRTGSEG
jgi:transcriptional regulator with XRE-family HTH domain